MSNINQDTRIKVLLVEDHAVVREGTAELLNRQPDMTVVGEAGDGQTAVEMALRLLPNVVLMDVGLPVLDGIAATRQIKAQRPTIAILALTAHDEDQYVFALLEAGAAGYLLKTVRSHELVEAVRAVNRGEAVLHPTVAKKVLGRFAIKNQPGSLGKSEPNQPTEHLTERELEVLKLAGRGLSNKEIADRLVLSPRTVQAHFANIFDKLEVGSRTEAVLQGLKRRILSLSDLDLEEGE
ncbi:MAG: response regulator transcription factor [Chloroflexi bacterium]|uniref:Response regulator transcription factor n=1 Tax=Candidatus Chlorohelix allophototropha TaxID=3003348 RepID=A0A8T7M2L9_9CHLR|nr:response regulator transcription factor [Chloroflexota bacterium]WJW67258.1 response regulator transcription factor [Chloroflexota bacterium L227-S17]